MQDKSDIESSNRSIHLKAVLSQTSRPSAQSVKPIPVARHSLLIMNELADSKNHAYVQHLEEYYQQLEKIMSSCDHKRIRSQISEFLVFIFNQIILTMLKYSIFCNYQSTKFSILLIQIFSIFSLLGCFYMVSIHLLKFGMSAFMRIYFSLDSMTLLLLVISIINVQMINLMGFSASCSLSLKVFFPVWLFYSAGAVRVQVMYFKWSKVQIIISKLVHLNSFVFVILVAFQFVYSQNYKALSNPNSCYIINIYCLAVCLFFVQFYRLISKFDGTNDFRCDYVFENHHESMIRKKKLQMQKKLETWRIKK